MHDAVPEYHTCNLTYPALGLRVAWGIAEDDVRFIPYWRNPAVKVEDPDVLASAWTRPNGKAMLMVLNLHKDPAEAAVMLRLDPAALGLRSGFKVYDLESQPAADEARRARIAWLAARRADPNAADGLLRIAREKADREEAFASYAIADLRVVSEGEVVEIEIPPRDWILLTAE